MYRPRAIRTNRGEEPVTFEARAFLTDDHDTGSWTSASTAAWMSRARIGSARSVRTWLIACTTQPGRRGRCRQERRSRTVLSARAAASFLTRRRSAWTSWFDSAATASTMRSSRFSEDPVHVWDGRTATRQGRPAARLGGRMGVVPARLRCGRAAERPENRPRTKGIPQT